VGKTETALGVADLLFGGERFMTVINNPSSRRSYLKRRIPATWVTAKADF
jgi:hypothetical protein